MILTDTHSHIYLKEEFENDINEVVTRLKETGVKHVFLPNIDNSTTAEMHELEATDKSLFHAMMGIHPTSINKDWEKETATILENFNNRSYCAVGEIGIDLYWDKTFVNEQIKAFETQVEFALQKDLPIIIHCREAFKEVTQSLKKFDKRKIKGIFHSFGGTVEEANIIDSLGEFYLGINGIITFKKSNLPEVIKKFPIEKIVLETDSPYLAPVPHRGKRNETSYVLHTATKIAEIKNTNIERVAEITTKNALELFSIK